MPRDVWVVDQGGSQLRSRTALCGGRYTSYQSSELSWTLHRRTYEAAEAVSLVTIHRSKGLEYHTVSFPGLDDDQWWAHNRDIEGSTATFFVGLSRAAQRVIFTQCDYRGRQDNIADLCRVLDDAGVSIQRFD